VIYSITETAKLNGLNPYYYLDHLLSKMPELMASKSKDQEYPDMKELEKLLPWSSDLPAKCRAKRR